MRQVKRGHATALTEILQGNLSALTSRDLGLAIARGDLVAISAARRSAAYVGVAIGSLMNVVDVGVVVIGGGIAEALGAPYVARASAIARRQVLGAAGRHVPIVASRLGDDAGLLGAAMVAFAGLARA
jgi:glucokinase